MRGVLRPVMIIDGAGLVAGCAVAVTTRFSLAGSLALVGAALLLAGTGWWGIALGTGTSLGMSHGYMIEAEMRGHGRYGGDESFVRDWRAGIFLVMAAVPLLAAAAVASAWL